MQISYDYYRVFCMVARYGSFTAAARALFSNQPNVTRTIQNLESTLGCTLFVRTNRGVRLTPEGERLYAHVSAAVAQIEAGEEELSLGKTAERGTISIGVTEVALRCFLLPVLKAYRAQYPGVHIRMTSRATAQAISDLKDGLTDFALVTTPTVRSDSLIEQTVRTIREVPLCSDAYPELLGGKVPLDRLRQYPIISLGADSKTHERYADFFARHGLTFAPAIEAAGTDQILPLVQADLGVGFLPEDMVRDTDSVRVIDLREKIPVRSICLIKRRSQALRAAASELERFMLAAAERP